MNKRLFQLIMASIVGLMFIFGDIFLLYAQESSSAEFTLEEIVVTAEKREADMQKVPIAMDAISGEELGLEGKTNVDDILRDLANVSIFNSQDGMRVAIRGLTDNGEFGDGMKTSGSMVGVNVDGVQNSESNAGQNLFDVERVEVLYGPQSTLYGSNSPGGIVNIVTTAPKTDKYSVAINANYGSFDSQTFQTVLNAPVIQDKVALRLSVSRSKQNSWFSGSTGSKNTSARLKILWQANDDLSITATPYWSKNSGGGMMGDTVKPFDYQDGYWWAASGGGPNAVTWTNIGKVTDPWTKAETQGGPGGGNARDQITKGLSGDINWTSFLGTVAFVPSYSKASSKGTMTNTSGYSFDTDDYTKQTGTELRMTNPEDFKLFQWIIGGTYNKSEQGMSNISRDPTVDSQYSYVISKKKALYANITYPLWFYEKFALTLGYRQSWDRMDSQFTGVPPWATDPNDVQADQHHSNFTKPDLKYGFNWDAADNVMVYGSYASSFRSVDAKSTSDKANEPETLKSYNLGAKSRFLDNKLQLNTSIYLYQYKNKYEQTESESAYVNVADWVADYPDIAERDDDGDGIAYVSSRGWPIVGDFKSLGVDISASWIITSRDRLNLSVSHLDAKWDSLTKPASEDYPLIFPEKSYKNITNFNSPTWSLTASYDHSFQLGSFGTLTPSMDAQYKSSTWLTWNHMDTDPHGVSFQEAYHLLNGSATFNHASGKWSVNANVKNILNYGLKRSYFAQGSGALRIGDPRTYQIGLNVKF